MSGLFAISRRNWAIFQYCGWFRAFKAFGALSLMMPTLPLYSRVTTFSGSTGPSMIVIKFFKKCSTIRYDCETDQTEVQQLRVCGESSALQLTSLQHAYTYCLGTIGSKELLVSTEALNLGNDDASQQLQAVRRISPAHTLLCD